jgi:S1-C subfamily serine protease
MTMIFVQQSQMRSACSLIVVGWLIFESAALSQLANAQSPTTAPPASSPAPSSSVLGSPTNSSPPSNPAPYGRAAQSILPASAQSDAKVVEEFRKELAEIKRKVDKPPKDNWDKLTAISGLASAIAVALIGFYATNVYNKRQKQTEEQRKDREILVAQIQTVEKFIPHLSSKDEPVKAAALVAIAALGNDNLAVKLATAFGGAGAASALTTIASTAGSAVVATAERALLSVLRYLEPRIVRVYSDTRSATGFIVSAQGGIVTAAHVVRDELDERLNIRLSDGSSLPASVNKVDDTLDLALLTVSTDTPLPPLNLSPSTPDSGMPISALFFDRGGELKVMTGAVIGLQVRPTAKVAVRLDIEPGASGGPVVDQEGRFLGLIQMSDLKGTVFLIPAGDVITFVNSGGVFEPERGWLHQ